MNELTVFKNEIFGEIRTIQKNDKVLFCGKDVAIALGYKEPTKAIREHCTHVSKIDIGVVTGKKKDGSDIIQNVETSFIPEGDVYRLIIRSKLESAQKFESWVFDEVLPSIRKHGVYAMDEILANPDSFIEALQALKKERAEKKQIEEQKKALQIKLDESEEWYSVKRMEKLNPDKEFKWSLLKKESVRLGKEIKKVFDQNYGEVNAYHVSVWESLYFDSINYD